MKSKRFRIGLTLAVVLLAAGLVFLKYHHYVFNPWTRDGQVRAQVIQITPRVTGTLVNLAVKDNQKVRKDDLLFEIDPRTFAAKLAQAEATLSKTQDDIQALTKQVAAKQSALTQMEQGVNIAQASVDQSEATLKDRELDLARLTKAGESRSVSQREIDRAQAEYDVARAENASAMAALLQAKAAVSTAEADLAQAQANLGSPGEENARLRAAKAAVEQARLDLEFTRVTAPVDGYVTNLSLRIGDPAVANQPALALIDENSFWVHGFFRETSLEGISPGDEAVITLMSYPKKPLKGRVDSVGWGIAQSDGSTAEDLLPSISPTFEWIRLAQRVPVRVHLTNVPEGVELRVGTTASVLVRKGTSGKESDSPAIPVPRALQ